MSQKESNMKIKTNFVKYLKDQFKDAGFSARFEKAAKAWDVAIHLAALRCREKNPDHLACPVTHLNGVHPARPVQCGTYLTGVKKE